MRTEFLEIVQHGADVAYVFGYAAALGSGPVAALSRNIMDYWISFTVSSNPNDRRGNATSESKVCPFKMLIVLTTWIGAHWGMYTPRNEVGNTNLFDTRFLISQSGNYVHA